MRHHTPSRTIGLDLGDRSNSFAVLDEQGELLARGSVPNRRVPMEAFLRAHPGALVAMETGTHSAWVSRLCTELGNPVLVGNSRRLPRISGSPRKSDEADALHLADMARHSPRLLSPVRHRGAKAEAHLCVFKAREQLVAARSGLISHVRSQVKGTGERLPKCSAPAFAKRAHPLIPAALAPALLPLLDTIAQLTVRIRSFDLELARIAEGNYAAETAGLRRIRGVGPLVSLAFLLVIEDPGRFPDPRDLGAWLGLTPRRDQSGARDPNLGITKAGNRDLRRLLVEASRYIMGPFGEDCDLRRFGLRILRLPPDATAAQIRERPARERNRAAVAVARKLALVMHRLWRTGDSYEPLHHAAA